MTHDELLIMVDSIHNRCKLLLSKKRKHRETDSDRMHQFNMGAMLRGKSTIDSITNQMEKHTTQLYSMIESPNRNEITLKEWREVIQDHINYNYMLLAQLEEDLGE